MRVGTLKTQVGQGGGLCGVWLHVCHVIGHVTTNDATDPPGVAMMKLRCGGILDHGDGSKESGVEVQSDAIRTG